MSSCVKTLACSESVALPNLTGLEAPPEPLRPLGGTPVRETLRTHMPRGHPLQTVVAHGCRGRHSRRDVRVVDDLALLRGMAPYARVAIRLQFQTHRKRFRLRWLAIRQPVHPVLDAQQFLHVVTYFMRYHIGLRELAWRPEPLAQLVKESQVDVDLLILGQ